MRFKFLNPGLDLTISVPVVLTGIPNHPLLECNSSLYAIQIDIEPCDVIDDVAMEWLNGIIASASHS